MSICVPHYAREVLARLEAAGHEAWFVGGCVRDSLLGRAPADWDIATSALPGQIGLCFGGRTLIEAGARHGTVGVVTEGGVVEATTFRVDGAYTGHRRPERVAFTGSLMEDLARRDFTVNAMAWHPRRGLADPFHGRPDLARGLLRCVGEPARRFGEDALRVLRCLRFAAVLGFAVEAATGSAALDCRELLRDISGERVREELTKLLCGAHARPVLEAYAPVLFTVLPELAPLAGCAQENPYHWYGCWMHTLHAVEAAPARPIVRWAALLHDCGKPAVKSYGEDGTAHFYGHAEGSARLAEWALDRLRFSNRDKERILTLVARHGEILPIGAKRMKHLLAELGREGTEDLLDLVGADVSAQAEEIAAKRLALLEEARGLMGEILARGDCLTLKSLAVNGGDLLALGYKPGPELGRTLKGLLEEVLAGGLQNERPALLTRAGEILGGAGKGSNM